MPHIIKGSPRDKWDEVQAIQHEPFIYIQYNGSRWAGEEEGDIDELVKMLETYKLDDFWNDDFGSLNPCRGIVNPAWDYTNQVPHFIDGPRMYAADGVRRFNGNFVEYSHAFCIDTNDQPTIKRLLEAFAVNQTLEVSQ